MEHQDGRKDPNNPTLLDTRQVEYITLLAAITSYLSGALPRDQMRALQVEWMMTDHSQKEFGPHHLFDLIWDFECVYAYFIETGDELLLHQELSKLVGYGATTGTVGNVVYASQPST